jgi:hypothetical protein
MKSHTFSLRVMENIMGRLKKTMVTFNVLYQDLKECKWQQKNRISF